MRLADPNNDFMRTVAYGGEEGLAMLQKRALLQSIQQKSNTSKGDINAFLNSLTLDELTLVVKEAPQIVG